ncbi:Vacuolar protein-sorting-associated protein 36 [Lithohypha guttulata]|nr:Vacuolar protein-sorting-associated protein 36 [Lithohypha guttulata]
MFFKKPELTAGSRPILKQDENLLFVQNGVGLYEGKFKIADCQNGHAYLTSHRACYIDDQNPKDNSLAFDLKDVDRYEYAAGFLRSSAKVTIHPKPLRRGPGSFRQNAPRSQGLQRLQSSSSSPSSRSSTPFRPNQVTHTQPLAQSASWICPICTFTNPIPSNFDPSVTTESFPVPPCLTCGITPDFAVILKAAISAGTSRTTNGTSQASPTSAKYNADSRHATRADSTVCPRCTFHNHPSLQSCEICGAALATHQPPFTAEDSVLIRPESPAPEISHATESDEPVSMKFSFRTGGDKVFYDKLKAAMVQPTDAPPIPKTLDSLRTSEPSSPTTSSFESRSSPRSSRVGIAGLEQIGKQSQKDNEIVIGAAFEDLDSLMSLKKEVSSLAQKIAREFGDEANRTDFDTDILTGSDPGMIATRDMLSSTSEKLYISELSRNLAEYVTDERRGLLRKRGGTMSLVDLWATFNRSRDGVELVSPSDFHKAATMWISLGLPVRLRQFKSGLMAVQYAYTSDERTIEQVKKWLESLRALPGEGVDWNWQRYGCGVTAQDAAKKFGWSLGIANEELEMAEEKGALVREDSIEGLKFWLNFFDEKDEDNEDDI